MHHDCLHDQLEKKSHSSTMDPLSHRIALSYMFPCQIEDEGPELHEVE